MRNDAKGGAGGSFKKGCSERGIGADTQILLKMNAVTKTNAKVPGNKNLASNDSK